MAEPVSRLSTRLGWIRAPQGPDGLSRATTDSRRVKKLQDADGSAPLCCESSMQDLTKGSISTHLVKTASFMLVTMVFQTLYFLVDLYWVGRLGKEAVAGVGIAGNLTFIVLAISQMLGVGTTTLVSHAAGQRDRSARSLVFNQSQVLSMLVGAHLPGRVDGAAGRRTRAARAPTRRPRRLAADYLLWFLPAMALQFCIVAMGSALRGIGNFKPGMVVQTATVIINIVLAPVLIFGWGTGVALGVAGAAIASLIAVVVGVVWLATYFVGQRAYLRFVKRRPDAAVAAVARHAEDRPARGRRVRDDGGLPVARLLDRAAVRRRGAGRVRHRDARSCRRSSCRSSRSASRWRRWPDRTSARGSPSACKAVFKDASLMAGGWMLLMAVALQHRAGRADRGSSRTTRRSSRSATNTCASSRGTSSPPG